MKMKVLFTTVVAILLSLGSASEASAQWCGPRGGGYYSGGGYSVRGPRVVVAVRPPVSYGYRAYPRHRQHGYADRCGRGHRHCSNRACYDGRGYRKRGYDRRDNYDRGRRYDQYDRY